MSEQIASDIGRNFSRVNELENIYREAMQIKLVLKRNVFLPIIEFSKTIQIGKRRITANWNIGSYTITYILSLQFCWTISRTFCLKMTRAFIVQSRKY